MAEKKITEGKTCIARTNPIDCVPSANDSPGPIARGPNRKIDPFCDACNADMRALFIHSRALRVQGNKKVIPPIAQANKILPEMVFLFICPLFPVIQAMKEIIKNPINAIPLYANSSIGLLLNKFDVVIIAT